MGGTYQSFPRAHEGSQWPRKIAKLEKLQVKHNKIKANPRDINKHLGVSTSDNSIANTPQDYTGTAGIFPSCSPSQLDEESSVLILTRDTLKSSDPDLSTNSDQESGVADLNCRSPSGVDSLPSEDSAKDPDSDEAANSAA
ncbi:UNVERIFIED_CONTAM: hypothetical protein FKN15_008302 [Acipenser sinensis]